MLSKRNKIQDFLLRDYPKVREAVNKRGTRYNASIDLIRKKQADIKIIEINPPELFQTTRFTKDRDILQSDYQLGLQMGESLIEKIVISIM